MVANLERKLTVSSVRLEMYNFLVNAGAQETLFVPSTSSAIE